VEWVLFLKERNVGISVSEIKATVQKKQQELEQVQQSLIQLDQEAAVNVSKEQEIRARLGDWADNLSLQEIQVKLQEMIDERMQYIHTLMNQIEAAPGIVQ
jgi:hypothetical protein